MKNLRIRESLISATLIGVVLMLSRILLIYVVLVLSSIVLDVVLVLSSIVLIHVVHLMLRVSATWNESRGKTVPAGKQ